MLRPDNDIVKAAMMENGEMAHQNKQCWSSYLDRYIHRQTQLDIYSDSLNPKTTAKIIEDQWFLNLSKHKDQLTLDARHYDQPTKSVVRNIPDPPNGGSTKGFKDFTYSRWFDPGKVGKYSRFWSHLNCKSSIQAVAQFRLGSHWLKIETCRFLRPKVPRSARLCSCCSSEDREDELHFMTCDCFRNIRANSSFMFMEPPARGSHQLPITPEANKISDFDFNNLLNPPASWVWSPDSCKLYKRFWDEFAFYLIRCRDLRASIMDFQNALVSPPEVNVGPFDLE